MTNIKFTDDTERLKALELVFIEQSAQAMVLKKIRGISTMKKICEIAGVDTTYVYCHKNPSAEDKIKYEDFQRRVNLFAKTFKDYKSQISDAEEDYETQLEIATEQMFMLQVEKSELMNKLHQRNNKINDLSAELTHHQLIQSSDKMLSPTEQLNDNTINVISPDKTLMHNDQYEFYDSELRENAWTEAKEEFQQLMRRKIPQRVYICIGLPCSGKSDWVENKKGIAKDRHAVIIDATNLTAGERAQWITLARKAIDVKICAVRLVTDFSTIKERNSSSKRLTQNKFIEFEVLEKKRKQLKEVEIIFEDFDEMLVIRENS
ncbi:AAA family ATPase [Colwellia psychrerythraea]|uniref:Uncharacterized protein n=1 Tax=Colwellia psychrerythraea TaxID=28229 RepID=A0A099KI35_COLPS|nr:AAA family ATPase [Colwellia psychrerythraea]KGJ89612.1 hypothetical protein ND2E_3803 [Colwellia psychrerythraea]